MLTTLEKKHFDIFELEEDSVITREIIIMKYRELAKKYHPDLNQGQFVATCVYNSYDCPQVWRLRRYRDNYLDERWWGKLFIKLYYLVSPKLVKSFGNNKLFRKDVRRFLDRRMIKLSEKGYLDTPYSDKY